MLRNSPRVDAWFAELYRSHSRNVFGLLVRLCDGDRQEAEDLTQETFVAAFQGRAAFAGRGSPRPWLLGIATRRWRDRNRRPQVPTVPPLDDDALPGDDGVGFEDLALDRLSLADALRRLHPQHREALLLVVSQRLTYREAAEILDEPVGTVKWRVHAASRWLRAHLSALEEPHHGNDRPTLEATARRAQDQP